MSNDQNEITENEFLAALPAESLERLLPRLDTVVLPPYEILYAYDDEITFLYFPNRNTVVSSLCTTDEKVDIEVAITGSNGIIGFSSLLGGDTSPYLNLVQVPGSSSRLAVEVAREEFRRGNRFQELVLQFINTYLSEVSQTALCNRVHSDEERLARWLLLSQDRIESNLLPLPRELLAKMLGRNHSGVSVTASILQNAGLITYNGAELTIVDRERLEAVACSCYWMVKRRYKRYQDSLKLGPAM